LLLSIEKVLPLVAEEKQKQQHNITKSCYV